MNYYGRRCMIKPSIIKNDDTFEIEKVIYASLSDFCKRHITVGKELKLLNIKPEYEKVTDEDLRQYTNCSNTIVLHGNTFYSTREAMEYFSKNYSRLIMYFDYED